MQRSLPKLTDRQRDLIAALAFSSMHIGKTAQMMGVSRSVTMKMIEDLEAKTGKNPRDFFDLHDLYEMAGR